MPVLVENDPAWADALTSGLPSGTPGGRRASPSSTTGWPTKSRVRRRPRAQRRPRRSRRARRAAAPHPPRNGPGAAPPRADRRGLPGRRCGPASPPWSPPTTSTTWAWPSSAAGSDLGGDPRAGGKRRRRRHGKVITVFSPKGGVGKTTVAVNLAVALAGSGAARVCIVDLDLAFGDVAITLQLIPEHTIAEAIGAEEHLDFAMLDTLLTRHENCAILAAPTHPEGKDRITPALVRPGAADPAPALRLRRRGHLAVVRRPGAARLRRDRRVHPRRHPRRAHREEHEDRARDARRARPGPGAPAPAAQPRRRRGRAVAHQRREPAQDAGGHGPADRARGGQRHQPRPADRAQQARAPGQQGAAASRNAAERRRHGGVESWRDVTERRDQARVFGRRKK